MSLHTLRTLPEDLHVDLDSLRKVAKRHPNESFLLVRSHADEYVLGPHECAHLKQNSGRNGILVQSNKQGELCRIVFCGGIHRTHFHRMDPPLAPAIIVFDPYTGRLISADRWIDDKCQ